MRKAVQDSKGRRPKVTGYRLLDGGEWARVSGFKPPLHSTLEEYMAWRRGLAVLKVFWASEEVGHGFIAAEEDGRILAAARAYRTPVYFHQKSHWRVEVRGEVQDIHLAEHSEEAMEAILEASEAYLSISHMSLGVSEWRSTYWSLLESCGLSPYSRSVLITWPSSKRIPKTPNTEVKVKLASPGEKKLARAVQTRSWGFFIPPDFSAQYVLIALLDGKPVGCAYVNKATGNIDFGVHVAREHQRKRIGTALLEKARRIVESLGLRWMTVVRVLALTKLRESDTVALSFYTACGGRLLREYRGFRRKLRRRKLTIPPLPELG